jgi:hypothetical protein
MERHYFADYEIHSYGQVAGSGQLAFTWTGERHEVFDPERVLVEVRRRAADRHGVEPDEIRVRALMRI